MQLHELKKKSQNNDTFEIELESMNQFKHHKKRKQN